MRAIQPDPAVTARNSNTAAREPWCGSAVTNHPRMVELRFFGGLSIEATAHVLDRSPATIKRSWRVAKAWPLRELRLRGNR